MFIVSCSHHGPSPISPPTEKKQKRMVKATQERPRRDKASDIVTRDHTIHMNKLLHGVTFKNRAPRAIREIKAFASKHMKTSDVRIEVGLNKFIWSQGVKNVPKRLRLRLSRRRNEDEEAKEKLYTLVSHVEVKDPTVKGLQTEIVEA